MVATLLARRRPAEACGGGGRWKEGARSCSPTPKALIGIASSAFCLCIRSNQISLSIYHLNSKVNHELNVLRHHRRQPVFAFGSSQVFAGRRQIRCDLDVTKLPALVQAALRSE
jgi:hypothetical protein